MKVKIYDKEIEYGIIRKNVKNITLRIKNDGSILITANNRISNKRIEDFIIEKKDWILKTLGNIESRMMLSNNYNDVINDKIVVLLGKEIKVIVEQAMRDEVNLIHDVLFIYTKDPSDKVRLNQLISKWISNYTKEVFEDILNDIYEKFVPYNVPFPKLRLRRMKTRWGTCSIHSTTITINTLLIHTRREAIEYVIAHEMAHFLHGNHSRNFYDSLFLVMPDHAMRRKMLKMYSLS